MLSIYIQDDARMAVSTSKTACKLWLLSSSGEGKVMPHTALTTLPFPIIDAVCFAGRVFCVGEKEIFVWNTVTGDISRQSDILVLTTTKIVAVTMCMSLRILVTVDSEGSVRVWDEHTDMVTI